MTRRGKVTTLATRLAVGLAALTAAYFATLDTWVRIIRKGNPEAVLQLRPTDARAMAQTFDSQLAGTPDATVSDAMRIKAQIALNHQPLNADALRLIGLWAAVRNSMTLSDRAMALSARVTRRETPVQFWLIERAVQRNDILGAISHYHAALSVTPSTRSVLFPILITSLSDADIRAAIRPYVERRTVWSTDLLNAAITEGDPRNVAALILPIARTLRTQPFQFTNAMLISR